MIELRRLFFLCCIVYLSFGCSDPMVYHKVTGDTMGTYYTLTYELPSSSPTTLIKEKVDHLLIEINDEVSTYIDSSIISQFNIAEKGYHIDDHQGHFVTNLEVSSDIYEETDGYFDPTVMPLVNYWGFGYTPKRPVSQIDSAAVDSIMNHIGFDKLSYRSKQGQVSIQPFDGQLDYSAIAKGYAVDLIAQLLDDQGAHNYYVEIGGELKVKGLNHKGKKWVIGINTPAEGAALDDLIEYLSISNKGMASSGNYRNYHEVRGRKYGHTINPKTGYPEQNELLAVTVIADDCMTADALATACMTMGFDLARKLITTKQGIEACFFTGSSEGAITKTYSDGFIQYVIR